MKMKDRMVEIEIFYRDGNNDKSYIDTRIPLSKMVEIYEGWDRDFIHIDKDYDSDSTMEIEYLGFSTSWLYDKTGYGYDERFDHNLVTISQIKDFENVKNEIINYTKNIRKEEFIKGINEETSTT